MVSDDLQTGSDALLAPLARAMVDQPRATLQDLARAVGVSKATLYRYCRTREQLIQRLVDHSIDMFEKALRQSALDSAPPLEALRRLIAHNLRHPELTTFLLYYWRDGAARAEDTAAECDSLLDAFFLRGQEQGVFRIDVPAQALTEIWTFLWVGLVEAERRGRVARAGLATTIESAFLKGALAA